MNNQSSSGTGGKLTPSREQIEVAAYYLFAQDGFRDGHAEEHWLKAEQMLSMPSVSEKSAAEVLDAGGSTKKKRTEEMNNRRQPVV
jgi:hypothetical protein